MGTPRLNKSHFGPLSFLRINFKDFCNLTRFFTERRASKTTVVEGPKSCFYGNRMPKQLKTDF